MVRVLEVFILLQQRRLVDVIIGRDAVVASYLGKLSHIVEVVAADIDIEEDREAMPILLADQVVELLTNWSQGLGQAGLQIDCIYRDVEGSDSRISQLIDYVCTQ